jgi:putative transposase
MVRQFSDRAPTQQLMRWVRLSPSTFYYRAHPRARGMKPSTHTLHQGSLVANETVVEQIRTLVSGPYNAYGYQSINDELRDLGYLINKKRTYRLMDEHKLLLGKVIRCSGKRNWVQYRKILATKPMEYLCLDIKYVWVQGEGRWYYLLSIMDVFSRNPSLDLWMVRPW